MMSRFHNAARIIAFALVAAADVQAQAAGLPEKTTVEIDLTTGVLANTPRVATGHIENASAGALDFVGSDGQYVANGVKTTLTYQLPADSGSTPATLPRYIGTTLPFGAVVFSESGFNCVYSTSCASYFPIFASRLGIPDGDLRTDPADPGAYPDRYYFEIEASTYTVSFDYSWTSSDQPGMDSATSSLAGNLSDRGPGAHHFQATTFGDLTLPNAVIQLANRGLPTYGAAGVGGGWGNLASTPVVFTISSVDNIYGPGRLSISNFRVETQRALHYFSIQAVPEPSELATGLLGIGMLAAARSHMLRRRDGDVRAA